MTRDGGAVRRIAAIVAALILPGGLIAAGLVLLARLLSRNRAIASLPPTVR